MTGHEGPQFSPQEAEREHQVGVSFGLYLPEYVASNEEVGGWKHASGDLVVDTKGRHISAEGIIKRTGIKERYVASPRETTLFMGEQAAKGALDGQKELYEVFFSSSYPVGINQARKLSVDLDLQIRGVLEIGAACSGFVRGLNFIKSRERRFLGQDVLFVSSEKYSDTVADLREINPEDEPSQAQLIFSDGATAVKFTYGKDFEILAGINHQVHSEDIKMPIDPTKRISPYLCEFVPYSTDYFRQNGAAVLRTVVREVPPVIDDVVRQAGLGSDDIKFIIPHQPSRHLLELLSQKSPEYTYIADIESGNFSSASIPKAWMGIAQGDEMSAYREGKLLVAQQYEINPGDKVVLAGFGAGFFASVALVEFH